ncbi:hypothetical protein GCM10020331_094930 [Ectobacillus funiculus]
MGKIGALALLRKKAKIFNAFVEAGGNFIDTAVNYTNGTSEKKYVGEFIREKA